VKENVTSADLLRMAIDVVEMFPEYNVSPEEFIAKILKTREIFSAVWDTMGSSGVDKNLCERWFIAGYEVGLNNDKL
jgi:hypothetical protein